MGLSWVGTGRLFIPSRFAFQMDDIRVLFRDFSAGQFAIRELTGTKSARPLWARLG